MNAVVSSNLWLLVCGCKLFLPCNAMVSFNIIPINVNFVTIPETEKQVVVPKSSKNFLVKDP